MAAESKYLHLSMKEGCVLIMRSTKEGCFRSYSWSLWKALEEEGGLHQVGFMVFGLVV
jgi:hypothetical protein